MVLLQRVQVIVASQWWDFKKYKRYILWQNFDTTEFETLHNWDARISRPEQANMTVIIPRSW